MHACKRLLEGSAHGYLAETAHVPVSAIAFSMPSATQLPINEDTSDAAEPAEGGASQPASHDAVASVTTSAGPEKMKAADGRFYT